MRSSDYILLLQTAFYPHFEQNIASSSVFEPQNLEWPYGTENTVAVHIRHLREKVEYNPAEPRYLKVVWGRGYKIEA